jgi:hypothetical protein
MNSSYEQEASIQLPTEEKYLHSLLLYDYTKFVLNKKFLVHVEKFIILTGNVKLQLIHHYKKI